MIGLLIAILLIILVVFLIIRGAKKSGRVFDDPVRRAGKRGEQTATNIIRSVLREDDHLFTNVEISHDGKPAELDNVIVNKYGVFIIEVKNYVGKLYGSEDDFEWNKYKTTGAGNTYEKTVKNPIKQVKRQVYILAGYLDYHGCHVWVEGRAVLLNGNSPVQSEYILSSINELDRTIHAFSKNHLDAETVAKICDLIS